MATSATPGSPFSDIMSPTANTSGCPGSEQSGCTAMRPARSHSAPVASASIRASGDAATPAAQIAVRVGILRVVPSAPRTSTPVESTCWTIVSVWISTPVRSSSAVPCCASLSPKVARISLPPSHRMTRISRLSKRR